MAVVDEKALEACERSISIIRSSVLRMKNEFPRPVPGGDGLLDRSQEEMLGTLAHDIKHQIATFGEHPDFRRKQTSEYRREAWKRIGLDAEFLGILMVHLETVEGVDCKTFLSFLYTAVSWIIHYGTPDIAPGSCENADMPCSTTQTRALKLLTGGYHKYPPLARLGHACLLTTVPVCAGFRGGTLAIFRKMLGDIPSTLNGNVGQEISPILGVPLGSPQGLARAYGFFQCVTARLGSILRKIASFRPAVGSPADADDVADQAAWESLFKAVLVKRRELNEVSIQLRLLGQQRQQQESQIMEEDESPSMVFSSPTFKGSSADQQQQQEQQHYPIVEPWEVSYDIINTAVELAKNKTGAHWLATKEEIYPLVRESERDILESFCSYPEIAPTSGHIDREGLSYHPLERYGHGTISNYQRHFNKLVAVPVPQECRLLYSSFLSASTVDFLVCLCNSKAKQDVGLPTLSARQHIDQRVPLEKILGPRYLEDWIGIQIIHVLESKELKAFEFEVFEQRLKEIREESRNYNEEILKIFDLFRFAADPKWAEKPAEYSALSDDQLDDMFEDVLNPLSPTTTDDDAPSSHRSNDWIATIFKLWAIGSHKPTPAQRRIAHLMKLLEVILSHVEEDSQKVVGETMNFPAPHVPYFLVANGLRVLMNIRRQLDTGRAANEKSEFDKQMGDKHDVIGSLLLRIQITLLAQGVYSQKSSSAINTTMTPSTTSTTAAGGGGNSDILSHLLSISNNSISPGVIDMLKEQWIGVAYRLSGKLVLYFPHFIDFCVRELTVFIEKGRLEHLFSDKIKQQQVRHKANFGKRRKMKDDLPPHIVNSAETLAWIAHLDHFPKQCLVPAALLCKKIDLPTLVCRLQALEAYSLLEDKTKESTKEGSKFFGFLLRACCGVYRHCLEWSPGGSRGSVSYGRLSAGFDNIPKVYGVQLPVSRLMKMLPQISFNDEKLVEGYLSLLETSLKSDFKNFYKNSDRTLAGWVSLLLEKGLSRVIPTGIGGVATVPVMTKKSFYLYMSLLLLLHQKGLTKEDGPELVYTMSSGCGIIDALAFHRNVVSVYERIAKETDQCADMYTVVANVLDSLQPAAFTNSRTVVRSLHHLVSRIQYLPDDSKEWKPPQHIISQKPLPEFQQLVQTMHRTLAWTQFKEDRTRSLLTNGLDLDYFVPIVHDFVLFKKLSHSLEEEFLYELSHYDIWACKEFLEEFAIESVVNLDEIVPGQLRCICLVLEGATSHPAPDRLRNDNTIALSSALKTVVNSAKETPSCKIRGYIVEEHQNNPDPNSREAMQDVAFANLKHLGEVLDHEVRYWKAYHKFVEIYSESFDPSWASSSDAGAQHAEKNESPIQRFCFDEFIYFVKFVEGVDLDKLTSAMILPSLFEHLDSLLYEKRLKRSVKQELIVLFNKLYKHAKARKIVLPPMSAYRSLNNAGGDSSEFAEQTFSPPVIDVDAEGEEEEESSEEGDSDESELRSRKRRRKE